MTTLPITEMPPRQQPIRGLRLTAANFLLITSALATSALAEDAPAPGSAPGSSAKQIIRVEFSQSSTRKQITRERIRVPGSLRQRSRQMILDFASPKTRELIVSYEQEIQLLNETPDLTREQRQRRDTLMRTRHKMMREIVMRHPNLHAAIRRIANTQRFRRGVMLARKIMNNTEAYQQVISRADAETAEMISRNNDSLRKISSIIEEESNSNVKACNANKMDALYKEMSSILDNQVGALERSGFVKTSYSE